MCEPAAVIHSRRSVWTNVTADAPFKSLEVNIALERGRGRGVLVLLAGHVHTLCSQELCIGSGSVEEGVGEHQLVFNTQCGK